MINLRDIRETISDTVRYAIGSELSQIPDPDNPPNTMGCVRSARPSKNASIPEYPYCVIDLLTIEDDQAYRQDMYFDELDDGIVYNTVKIITYQLTVYDDRRSSSNMAIQLANDLYTSLRKPDVRDVLRDGDIGVLDTELVTSSPDYYDTDFVEQGVVILQVRVNDTEIVVDDVNGSAIETINAEGELDHFLDDPEPLLVSISATEDP